MAKQHPLKRYKRKHGLTYDEVAALCTQRGYSVTGTYVKFVANGIRRTGWDFANFLVEKIFDSEDAITVDVLMEFCPPGGKRAA